MLPRIPSPKTVVIPATEEKVFPDKFIVGLSVLYNEDGTQPCNVALQAYNYDTKEVSPDPSTVEHFGLQNIWDEAQRSPVFAEALGSLVNVIMLMYQERTLLESISGMAEGPERDAAIASLTDVQSQLQVPPAEIPPPFEEVTNWAK